MSALEPTTNLTTTTPILPEQRRSAGCFSYPFLVSDAHIRKVPVLAITDSMASPLARNSSLYFVVRDAEVHRFRPLAAPTVLAQSLIIALGYYRDARIAQAAAVAGKPVRTKVRRKG